MINIERALLCSVLEHGFIDSDEKIINHKLNSELFSLEDHTLFVNSINRLKELKEPICSDIVRLKLISVNKWNFQLEHSLLEVMSANPFSTYDLFSKYYKVLQNNYDNNRKLHQLRYI